ncbi:MAG TPA: type IV toxin-antitoxin system AbiEi family antitoxin domain-containing protein [Solirubrobacteraceae bacterium]
MAASVDRAIAALARRQQGNITRQQLLRLGLRPDAITHRCQTGWLHREHQGVYGVGRKPATSLERASAAVLACGQGAALCGPSAFTLWGFDKQWRFPVHVCAPTNHKHPGIATHRFPSLAKQDVRTHLGIRVTSPARTFLDNAPHLTRQQLRRTLSDARRSGNLKPAALHDVLDRNPKHPGRAPLTAAIKAYQPTRSEFEDAFVRFCAQYRLPTPQINTIVRGHEVDALFPDERLIVELDGWDFHRDRHAFEDDRDRDADALAAGLPTVRITWERMNRTPSKEATRLQTILAARRRS